jgi:hypothetical protein
MRWCVGRWPRRVSVNPHARYVALGGRTVSGLHRPDQGRTVGVTDGISASDGAYLPGKVEVREWDRATETIGTRWFSATLVAVEPEDSLGRWHFGSSYIRA